MLDKQGNSLKMQKSKKGSGIAQKNHLASNPFLLFDLINDLFYATADLHNTGLIQPVIDEFTVSLGLYDTRPP